MTYQSKIDHALELDVRNDLDRSTLLYRLMSNTIDHYMSTGDIVGTVTQLDTDELPMVHISDDAVEELRQKDMDVIIAILTTTRQIVERQGY